MIRKGGLLLAAVMVIFILLHAWRLLEAPSGGESSHALESEAEAEGIWVDEGRLESNKNITQSLKEAVLGAGGQKKDLIVFEQKISDIIKVTDNGSLPFHLSAKYQYVKYSGTASYTVDLSRVDDAHLTVDGQDHTVTIRIPHAALQLYINEEETQADDTEKIGIFSIGDLKLSQEERAEVIATVRRNMEAKLEEEAVADLADRMAELSVWEIYQPVVSGVSPDYSVKTVFTED